MSAYINKESKSSSRVSNDDAEAKKQERLKRLHNLRMRQVNSIFSLN
jgi:hypothetical protein